MPAAGASGWSSDRPALAVMLARELGAGAVRLGVIGLATLTPAGSILMWWPGPVRSMPGGAATLVAVAWASFFGIAVLLLARRVRTLRRLLREGVEVDARLIGVDGPFSDSEWRATYKFRYEGETHHLVTWSLFRAWAARYGDRATVLVDPSDPRNRVLLRGHPEALGRSLRQMAMAPEWQWILAAAGIPAAMAAGLGLPTPAPGWVFLTALAALAALLRAIEYVRRARASTTPMPARVSALVAAALAAALGLLLCMALTAILVLALTRRR